MISSAITRVSRVSKENWLRDSSFLFLRKSKREEASFISKTKQFDVFICFQAGRLNWPRSRTCLCRIQIIFTQIGSVWWLKARKRKVKQDTRSNNSKWKRQRQLYLMLTYLSCSIIFPKRKQCKSADYIRSAFSEQSNLSKIKRERLMQFATLCKSIILRFPCRS